MSSIAFEPKPIPTLNNTEPKRHNKTLIIVLLSGVIIGIIININMPIPNANIKNEIDLFYRASFFGAGIKELCRIWLERDCVETPEQMAKLLYDEYRGNDH